jgi:Ca2+-binding EF-hand superfamily protein
MLGGLGLGALLAATAMAAPPAPMARDGAMDKPITRAEFMAKVDQRFQEADTNHDGAVTRGELLDARDARMRERMKEYRDREFTMLDANHDNALSRAEFDAGRPHGPPPGMKPGMPGEDGPRGRGDRGPMGGGMMLGDRMFERADANHDGKVTLAEARTAAAAMFDRLDTNHDGTVTPEERRAAFARIRGHEGRWRRGSEGRGGPGGDMPPPPPPVGM